MYTILILLLFLLLSISAILSGSETALFSLSSLKVSILKNDPSWRKRCVASLLEKPKDLLVTILMVNIAMNILVQNVISNVFDKNSGPLLTVGLPLVLTLFLGEAIPKSIAITRNLQISVMTAPILYAIRIFISPIRKVLTKLAQKISRFIFFFLKKEPEISYDELKHALITSQKSGIISREEAKLIHGALKIDESLVKAIMTARSEILLYNIEDPIDQLLHTFVDEECSQVPVIHKNLDEVLGVITSASFFLNKTKIKTGEDLKLYLKRALFVPETITARKLLMNFHAANETIALAVDEYGQISGLVTKEDVVELVVGQIEDKRDEEVLYTKQGDDAIICSGKLEIAILEEIFDTTFEHAQNAVTIGGWLTEKEGDIPKSGLKIKTNDFLFQVLSSSKSKVDKIYVRRLKS
jgi:putative hemolysin